MIEHQREIENISTQSLIYLGCGVLIVVFMFVIMNAVGVPFTNVILLVFIGIVGVCFGSITLNCMVVGQCVTLAWIWVVIGLVVILSNMVLQTMLLRKRY